MAIMEILIVVALIVVSLVCFLGIAANSLKLSALIKQTTVADFLAKDAIESIRAFRDETDWDLDGLASLSTSISYHPQLASSWSMALGQETIGDFTREVVLEDVSRDSNGNIEDVYDSLNKDENTKKVIVRVFWSGKQIEIITYLTNWK